jgi:predicted ester cyclase
VTEKAKAMPGRVSMSGGATPALDQHRDVITQFIEGTLNRQRPGRPEAIFDENANMEHGLLRERIRGVAAIQKFIDQFHRGFPDFKARAVKMVAEGDQVAFFLECQGTHKGEFEGMPPTNKPVRWLAANFATIRNGKIQEMHITDNVMQALRNP